MNQTNKNNIFLRFISNIRATIYIFTKEFRGIFRDRGVMIIIILAPIIYPLLYPYLYKNETVIDVPVAVVDLSQTENSRAFVRNLDATRDIKITKRLDNLEQAKTEFYKGDIHGIVYIPREFNKNIMTGKQTNISVYADMSSFLYYRAVYMAVNYVGLDLGEKIQLERLNKNGQTGELAKMGERPISNEGTILYNSGMGFSSFLLIAVLVLMIHQTLVFGIGMAAGADREDNPNGELVTSTTSRGGLFRVILGRALSYFILYLFWSVFILMVVPQIFNLPHIGDVYSIIQVIIPFLLATIFFSMMLSVFNFNRETQMILLVFFSLILLFLSGISWPQSNLSAFWKTFSYLFPSTFGIQGYVKANAMGATFPAMRFEIAGLWIQTLVYFVITSILYYREIRRNEKVELAV